MFDSLDGQVARLIGIATPFGVEYDSLADMVTFGVAPAFLWVSILLEPMGRLGWASGFIFVVGAAVRLARFNIQSEETLRQGYFQGLPSPGAAGTLASWSWVLPALSSTAPWVRWVALLLPPLLAALMVSVLPYRHFKQPPSDLQRSRRIVAVATVLALAVAAPEWVLPLLFGVYVVSAPLLVLWRRWRRPTSSS